VSVAAVDICTMLKKDPDYLVLVIHCYAVQHCFIHFAIVCTLGMLEQRWCDFIPFP